MSSLDVLRAQVRASMEHKTASVARDIVRERAASAAVPLKAAALPGVIVQAIGWTMTMEQCLLEFKSCGQIRKCLLYNDDGRFLLEFASEHEVEDALKRTSVMGNSINVSINDPSRRIITPIVSRESSPKLLVSSDGISNPDTKADVSNSIPVPDSSIIVMSKEKEEADDESKEDGELSDDNISFAGNDNEEAILRELELESDRLMATHVGPRHQQEHRVAYSPLEQRGPQMPLHFDHNSRFFTGHSESVQSNLAAVRPSQWGMSPIPVSGHSAFSGSANWSLPHGAVQRIPLPLSAPSFYNHYSAPRVIAPEHAFPGNERPYQWIPNYSSDIGRGAIAPNREPLEPIDSLRRSSTSPRNFRPISATQPSSSTPPGLVQESNEDFIAELKRRALQSQTNRTSSIVESVLSSQPLPANLEQKESGSTAAKEALEFLTSLSEPVSQLVETSAAPSVSNRPVIEPIGSISRSLLKTPYARRRPSVARHPHDSFVIHLDDDGHSSSHSSSGSEYGESETEYKDETITEQTPRASKLDKIKSTMELLKQRIARAEAMKAAEMEMASSNHKQAMESSDVLVSDEFDEPPMIESEAAPPADQLVDVFDSPASVSASVSGSKRPLVDQQEGSNKRTLFRDDLPSANENSPRQQSAALSVIEPKQATSSESLRRTALQSRLVAISNLKQESQAANHRLSVLTTRLAIVQSQQVRLQTMIDRSRSDSETLLDEIGRQQSEVDMLRRVMGASAESEHFVTPAVLESDWQPHQSSHMARSEVDESFLYLSPLIALRSHRILHRHNHRISSVPKDFDVSQPVCQFDLLGHCNDDSCKFAHLIPTIENSSLDPYRRSLNFDVDSDQLVLERIRSEYDIHSATTMSFAVGRQWIHTPSSEQLLRDPQQCALADKSIPLDTPVDVDCFSTSCPSSPINGSLATLSDLVRSCVQLILDAKLSVDKSRSKDSVSRYFLPKSADKSLSCDAPLETVADWDAALANSAPDNVAIWLDYALWTLNSSRDARQSSVTDAYHTTLSLMSRAVDAHAGNEYLWNVYLGIVLLRKSPHIV